MEKPFSDILIAYRKKHGLTQTEMAGKLGMTTRMLQFYESGEFKGTAPKSQKKIAGYKAKLLSPNFGAGAKATTPRKQTPPDNPSIRFKAIPYYDIDFSTNDVVFSEQGLIENQEPDDYFYIPVAIDADFAFPNIGDSMHPVLSNGDMVAYKYIRDLSFFNYGLKHLIVTSEQRMVRFLNRHNQKGMLLLESNNADFAAIDMPIKSIKHILQVRYIGKIEM